MKRSLLVLTTVTLSACGGVTPVTPAPDAEAPSGPFSVILYVGDGTGLAHWSAARLASSDLGIARFPVIGLVDTRSSDSWVTDSGAGATAYSAGVRTFNGAIGVGPDSAPVTTVLELAADRRMATGLVATSTLTHATPASFAAHVPSRNQHWDIALQMAEQGVDVLLGGGRRYFDPTRRPDRADLIGGFRRAGAYVETGEQLEALDLDRVSRLVGLFIDDNPGPATGRSPSLQTMTGAALEVLEQDDEGFFLMVEGSQIDWRAHENAPLRQVIAEVLDFDLAIRQGLAFQERRPNTLLLVVADHETGGLALHADAMGVFRAHYTTESHTAEMIPLFARGPGAARFGGLKRNDEVGRLLLELVAEGGAAWRAPHASTSPSKPWTPSSH